MAHQASVISQAASPSTYRASALQQWHAAGGDVLERRAQGSEQELAFASDAREAFVAAQTAAALDVAQLALLRALRELNGSAEPAAGVEPPPAPPPDRYADDHSDGSSAQGTLVRANVRAGKPEEVVATAGEYRAPNGSLRYVLDGLLSGPECSRLLGATLVAMAGAFSQCGQTRLGMSPALAARMGALPAGGGPSLGLLYSTVERVRRTVARAFGADLGALRVSDATLVRLQAAAEAASGAAAAGALDVGVLRGDRFCYWRPHIDQVSVGEYEYSALLYLAQRGSWVARAVDPASGDDFDGGRLVFHDSERDVVIMPTPGTLVAFDSGHCNLHAVERVSRGSRFALTMWFTSQPEPADIDPVHHALLHWARDAVGAAEAAAAAGAPAPAPPPLPPAVPGLGGGLLAREAELVSASLCSLPANDPLGAALRYAHARGGHVAHTLARGLGLPVEAAHCAPRADDGAPDVPADAPSASGGPPPTSAQLLRSRLQAHAAMAATLQRAQEARTAAQQPAKAAVPAAAAEDDFDIFD